MVSLQRVRAGFAVCFSLGIVACVLTGAAGCARHVVAEPGEVAARNSREWNIRRENSAGARPLRTAVAAPKGVSVGAP